MCRGVGACSVQEIMLTCGKSRGDAAPAGHHVLLPYRWSLLHHIAGFHTAQDHVENEVQCIVHIESHPEVQSYSSIFDQPQISNVF